MQVLILLMLHWQKVSYRPFNINRSFSSPLTYSFSSSIVMSRCFCLHNLQQFMTISICGESVWTVDHRSQSILHRNCGARRSYKRCWCKTAQCRRCYQIFRRYEHIYRYLVNRKYRLLLLFLFYFRFKSQQTKR